MSTTKDPQYLVTYFRFEVFSGNQICIIDIWFCLSHLLVCDLIPTCLLRSFLSVTISLYHCHSPYYNRCTVLCLYHVYRPLLQTYVMAKGRFYRTRLIKMKFKWVLHLGKRQHIGGNIYYFWKLPSTTFTIYVFW